MSMDARSAQRGLSLIFALLALVALSVASVALIRSVDTGTLVLGNLGYKQETTALAEQGTQAAIRWLSQQADAGDGTTLNNAIEGITLYAAAAPTGAAVQTPEAQLPLVAASVRTAASPSSPGAGQCTVTVASGAAAATVCPPGSELFVFGPNNVLLGNVRYSVTRLCRNAGAVDGNDCVRPAAQAAGEAPDRGSLSYTVPDRLTGTTEGILYRIVVRAQGTRDTTTYTETIVQR
jgi:hypothetical protein